MTGTVTQLISLTPADLAAIIKNAVIEAQKEFIKPTSDPVEEKLLCRKEAAAYLGISLVTLDSHSLSGKIKAYRIGKNTRYKKSELIGSLVPYRLK